MVFRGWYQTAGGVYVPIRLVTGRRKNLPAAIQGLSGNYQVFQGSPVPLREYGLGRPGWVGALSLLQALGAVSATAVSANGTSILATPVAPGGPLTVSAIYGGQP